MSAYLFSTFRASVWESLENDQRFQALLNEACNRAIDEVLAESDYGNFKYITDSVLGQEEYDMPENTLYINNLTYDNVPLEKLTFSEYLSRKSYLSAGIITTINPSGWTTRNNRTIILSPVPNENTKKLVVYTTVRNDDLGDADVTAGTPWPLARVYSKSAWHFARHWLLKQDGQDERAARDYAEFEHEQGKINRRLRGSVKEKVKRVC